MQKYFIYLFVGIFAVLSVVQGVSLFEEYHNNRLNEPHRMVVDFDPQKLYGFTFTASSEKLMDYVDELRRLADSHDAGLFLQFSSSEKEQEEQENSKKSSLSDAPESTMTYIFSSNPSLFPDYAFSDKKVDWSASGRQAYVWALSGGCGQNQPNHQ